MRRTPPRFDSLTLGAVVAALGAGCAHGEPPTWDGGNLSLAPLPAVPIALTTTARVADAATDGDVDAGSGVDPGTLPQTRDRPRDSPRLQDRARILWDAIVHDDPDVGLPFFFPVTAYKQVKAVTSPEGDWRRRLVGNYKRDVHKLHEKLGAAADAARLIELDVPQERARWVEPGEEGNKLGYFRVYGGKLRYESDRGAGAIDVSSLISWRGEWYVVHLSSFR